MAIWGLLTLWTLVPMKRRISHACILQKNKDLMAGWSRNLRF